ncbi:MAG: hypothetical protein CMF41_01180 [Legionellales bacterium]|nr:hypothetical protein [Legionellales bacterium]|tara:strand:+ start:2763 stop:3980 length:1218 start_codon:yes stop_codon:yes gene_type:complete
MPRGTSKETNLPLQYDNGVVMQHWMEEFDEEHSEDNQTSHIYTKAMERHLFDKINFDDFEMKQKKDNRYVLHVGNLESNYRSLLNVIENIDEKHRNLLQQPPEACYVYSLQNAIEIVYKNKNKRIPKTSFKNKSNKIQKATKKKGLVGGDTWSILNEFKKAAVSVDKTVSFELKQKFDDKGTDKIKKFSNSNDLINYLQEGIVLVGISCVNEESSDLKLNRNCKICEEHTSDHAITCVGYVKVNETEYFVFKDTNGRNTDNEMTPYCFIERKKIMDMKTLYNFVIGKTMTINKKKRTHKNNHYQKEKKLYLPKWESRKNWVDYLREVEKNDKKNPIIIDAGDKFPEADDKKLYHETILAIMKLYAYRNNMPIIWDSILLKEKDEDKTARATKRRADNKPPLKIKF